MLCDGISCCALFMPCPGIRGWKGLRGPPALCVMWHCPLLATPRNGCSGLCLRQSGQVLLGKRGAWGTKADPAARLQEPA